MSQKQDHLVESVKSLVNQMKLRENEIELIKERCTKIKTRINYIKTFHEDSIELTELLKKIPCNFVNSTPFQENRQVRELELENAELQISLEEHQAAMEIIMTKYRQQIHALIGNNHIDWPIIRDQEYQHDLEMRTSIDRISNIGELMWTSLQYDSDFIYDLEIISSLRLENDGLEKMLADSSSFGNTCTWNMDEIDDQSTAAMSESTTSGGLGGLATPDDDAPLWMSSSFCSVKNVPKSDKLQTANCLSTFKKIEPFFSTSYADNSENDNVQSLPLKKDYKQCNGHINGHGDIQLDLAKFENGNPVFVNDENVTLNQSKVKESDLIAIKNHKTNLNTINGSMDSLEFDNLSESTLEYESDVTLASDTESIFNTRDLTLNTDTFNQTEDEVPSPNDVETPCSLVYITSPMNGISNKMLYDEKSACLINQCSPKNKSWTIEKSNHRSSDVTAINQVVNNNEKD